MNPCSWDRYVQLSALFPDSKSLRLTYLDGVLEIMSPIGEHHERQKRTVGYFVEAYCPINMRLCRRLGRCLATRMDQVAAPRLPLHDDDQLKSNLAARLLQTECNGGRCHRQCR